MRGSTHDAMIGRVDEWLGRHGLREAFAPKLEAAITWVVTCSPPGSGEQELSLATADLLLWFLYIDDYSGADYATLYGHCRTVLHDHRASIEWDDAIGRRALALLGDHLARIDAHARERGLSMHRYVREREIVLEQYRRRNGWYASGYSPSIDEYVRLRSKTILFRIWFALWEILGDFQLTDAEYSSRLFDRAIEAELRWHVYQNEIFSHERDTKNGYPNLLDLLVRDRRSGVTSIGEAIRVVESECDRFLAELAAARRELEAAPEVSERMWTAIRFLEHNTEGGRRLYEARLDRYSRPRGE